MLIHSLTSYEARLRVPGCSVLLLACLISTVVKMGILFSIKNLEKYLCCLFVFHNSQSKSQTRHFYSGLF